MRSGQPLFLSAYIAHFVASIAISFVLAACATAPLTHESTIGVTKEALRSLIGADERTVVEEIGDEPGYRVQDESSTYLVYMGGSIEGNMWVVFTPWPIPLPFPLIDMYGTDCLLLQFDEGEFTRFQFESIFSGGCRETFWSRKEIEKFEQLRMAELEKKGAMLENG